MRREELAEFGVKAEHIDSIMALNGRDIERHKAAAANSELQAEQLRNQLSDANKKLEGYDPEWQQKLESANESAQHKITAFRFENAMGNTLAKYGARDILSVKAHVAMDGLTFNKDTGEIDGLDDQILDIRQKYGYLFNGEVTAVPVFSASTAGAAKTRTSANEEANTAIRALFGKD